MSRALRSMPWVFALAAAVFGAYALLTGTLPDPTWRVAIIVSGVGAATIAWRVHRMPVLFAGVMAVASGRLAGMHFDMTEDSPRHLHWHHAAADLLVGACLTGMLALVLWRRYGRIRLRDTVDLLTVAIGAGLIAWMLAASPLLERLHDAPLGLVLISAAYLPITVLLATFTIDLTLTGLTSNRTMRFVTIAVVTNVAAGLVAILTVTGELPTDGRVAGVTLYGAAFFLMCAGLSHRDAPATLERLSRDQARRTDTPGRLAVMAVSVLVPLVFITTMVPTSDADVAVRTVGSLALMLAIVFRLRIAMREHARAHRALIEKLNRDELTGLPNRTRFVECVDDALETTWRTERHPTIVQLNLDRFKNINDSLGHYDANQVLVLVSERLSEAVAPFAGVVARSGGDDFVVLDGSTSTSNDAMQLAAAIRDALAPPVAIADSTVFVTASIGVAMAPAHRTITAEELMRRADIATHRAKSDGRNRVSLFDDSMQANLAQRMDVEHALHGAIGRNEMRLFHQPIVDLESGRISGFEALMRWQRGDQLVPPNDFIPIAEETGIICELGAWALHDALRELRRWIDEGVVPAGTTMSVNVSPRQIADPNFAGIVVDALERSGVPAELLWLEMTESMMLEEPELAQTTLQDVRKLGVSLALDDFGTGFSSLSLLQQFPIQRIKIDRAFVQGVDQQGNDRSLVRTMIAMAQAMDLDVVAEGVETVEQLQSLRELKCWKAQGFLISRPVPPDAMRSTMVALEALTSLSVFGSDGDNHPTPPSEPSYARSTPMPSVRTPSSPIGAMMSRPLGHPRL